MHRRRPLARRAATPEAWWPEHPDVVGGRDRVAGGTWCATSIGTAATALVVNRPQKQVADPGAPSRGVLPLLAVEHGPDWLDHFDGQDLASTEHPEGTSMLTPGGPENRKADVHPRSFPEAAYPDGWRRLVQNGPAPVER